MDLSNCLSIYDTVPEGYTPLPSPLKKGYTPPLTEGYTPPPPLTEGYTP
jgi:hypothetical protein